MKALPAQDPGLYLITDRRLPGGGARGLADAVVKALEAGVRMVQLREKDLEGRELLEFARLLRAETLRFGAMLIINDRIDVAILSKADGVHLGAASVRPPDARLLLGKTSIIGASAHSVQEALQAEAEGADFITFGPVYFTGSKARWGKPLGLDALREVAARVKMPVYAIGGVNSERINEALSAGADGVAVISAVLASADVSGSALKLVNELKERRNHQKEGKSL